MKRLLAVVPLILLLLTLPFLATNCSLNSSGHSPPLAPSRMLSVESIADQMARGSLSSDTMKNLYLWSESQRSELKTALLERMTEDQINGRSDIFSIIGPLHEQEIPIDQMYAQDREHANRLEKSATLIQEYIPVNGIPWFSQRDSRWSGNGLGYKPPPTTIGLYGCYLTDIAMLLKFWGCQADPLTLNNWSVGSQAHYAFSPASEYIWTSQAIQFPGACRPWSTISKDDPEAVRRQLRAGHPVIVWTTWGGSHFMIIYCWDGSQFWVLDPWQTSTLTQPLSSYYGSIKEFRLLGYYPV